MQSISYVLLLAIFQPWYKLKIIWTSLHFFILDCDVTYHKVGCYKRNKNVFPTILVNHRDGIGTELDWRNFQSSISR